MSQNPQTNTSTKDDQPFFNNGLDSYSDGSQQVIQLDQYSLNNSATVTSDNSLPVLYTTSTPMTSFVYADLTSQSYPTMSYEAQYNFNNVSTEQVSTQNLPPYITTPSEIIIHEIPGYDVFYIPKPNPFVNSNINLSMQQDSNSLNSSSVISTQQQSYFSSVSGISAGESSTNPIIIDP